MQFYRWMLSKYKRRFESKIDLENFDVNLSRQIDCLTYLLDLLNEAENDNEK